MFDVKKKDKILVDNNCEWAHTFYMSNLLEQAKAVRLRNHNQRTDSDPAGFLELAIGYFNGECTSTQAHRACGISEAGFVSKAAIRVRNAIIDGGIERMKLK